MTNDNGWVSLLAVVGPLAVWYYFKADRARKQREIEETRLGRMTPEERKEDRLEATFGPVNPVLVCPHCQTTGSVRAKSLTRVINTQTKTNLVVNPKMTHTSSKQATQLHCDNCTISWDV